MKRAFRKILLSVAAVFMFLSASCALALALPAMDLAASAEAAWKTGTFAMEDGTSLKLGTVGGMRYIVKMDEAVASFVKETEDAELGFIIAPKQLMLEANGDYLNMSKWTGGKVDKNKIYKQGGSYYANGCITGVKSQNLQLNFVAVAYISYGGEVRYTKYNDYARNNLYDLVNMAALNGYGADIFGEEKVGGYAQNGEGNGWYGSEKFPIVVESTEEYDSLISVSNENDISLAEYTVVVKNNATPSFGFEDTACKPTIISGALNEVNKLIAALPISVEMPNAIGVISRIYDVEEKYQALSEAEKSQVEGYEKVEGLLEAIVGYDRVYKNDANDGTVIPSYLPKGDPDNGFASTTGGVATIRQDDVYGNVMTVTSDGDGRAALHYKNFPDVSNYLKIYFYVKVSVSCYLYLSDGITNDGWGDNWKNTWSVSGFWCNADTWKLVEIDVKDGYVGANFALAFRTNQPGIVFEVSDFYGFSGEYADANTGLFFGNVTAAGTHAEYGQIYDLTQGWNSSVSLGSFAVNAFKNSLGNAHNNVYFWIYNPNDTDVSCWFEETTGWTKCGTDVAVLKAKAWTKVIVNPEIIEINTQYGLCLNVTSGAGTSGWQISSLYSTYVAETRQPVTLEFGVRADTGMTNGYGTLYNLTREQYYISQNDTRTIGTLQQNALATALPAGYTYFYFWLYNPTDTVYNFHLAGSVNGTWTDTPTSTVALAGKTWTKVSISADDIQLNTQGQWYVYFTGGDNAGSAKDGWMISTIYAGPNKQAEKQFVYSDHEDVKETIALIDAIPEPVTLADKEAVAAARAAYDKLTARQQTLVGNYALLTAAETVIEDIQTAEAVISMIDAIDPRSVDEDLVQAARTAYEALSASAKSNVTNLSTLEGYEAEINAEKDLQAAVDNVNGLISALPDSVVMPDHLVFVHRIEVAGEAYDALSEVGKAMIENYGKLRSLRTAIKGYETVHVQTLDSVNVIPNYHTQGGFTSTTGGTASLGYDGYYGNYLRVDSASNGTAAIQYVNFPDVTAYTKIYFNVRLIGTGADVYLSDGTANNGWGDNWKNTWSNTVMWVPNGSWIQKELDVSTGIFASNLAICFETNVRGISFEITDFVGVKPELGQEGGLYFGKRTDTGTVNAYGTVYNFEQGWTSNTDMGAFNAGSLASELDNYKGAYDSLRFYIYNPNETDVNFRFMGEYNGYNPTGEYLTALKSKQWTEVVITPKMVEENSDMMDVTIGSTTIKKGLWYVSVSEGANAEGWQISPLYAFSSGDFIDKVQARIDALNTETVDEYQVTLAREAYEELSESHKALLDISKLITCEEALYGNVTNAPFIVNGISEYKIYVDLTDATFSGAIKKAVAFMNEHLAAATGVEPLPIVSEKPSKITKYRYAIVFGHADLYESLSGESLADDLGASGYRIVRMGRTVFIMANDADGYRMGMLAFLRETIGYDMLSEDCVVYDVTAETSLPMLDVKEVPTFAYRQQQTYLTKEEIYGMGMQSHTEIWIPVEGEKDGTKVAMDMHNTLYYIPRSQYSSHTSWYSQNDDSAGTSRLQICPTADGSSTEFAAMVEAISTSMVAQINADPTIENISFSLMDSAGGDYCTCSRCTLYNTLYGEGGFAAAWIDLMNAINAKVRPQLNGRKINIAFLAYRDTETAPVNDDLTLKQRYVISDDGSYSLQTDGRGNPVYLKCDEGVTVWLAPINAKYAENFNHSVNADALATIKKWSKLSSSVYLWTYGTNFKNYLYPYNTWRASAENYKILADLGVKAVWSQSNETEATAFTDLKGYIDSKFFQDANSNYETVLDTYFANYFGAGAEKMRSMFDQIVAKCDEIENDYNGLGRGIYDDIENKAGGWFGIGKKTYWSESWLEGLVTLCDEAKALVDADSSISDEEKTAIKNRITKESLFPRYVLCSSFSQTGLRAAFKADAQALGFTLYREANGELSSLYATWGV